MGGWGWGWKGVNPYIRFTRTKPSPPKSTTGSVLITTPSQNKLVFPNLNGCGFENEPWAGGRRGFGHTRDLIPWDERRRHVLSEIGRGRIEHVSLTAQEPASNMPGHETHPTTKQQTTYYGWEFFANLSPTT